MAKRYYITTPIYYVNDRPHIGSSLTTFVCDMTKRYMVMRGVDTYFLTGVDENGLKVMEAAQKNNVTPKDWVDQYSARFIECWKLMGFEYDDFIRTTEPRHVKAVQRFFEILRDKGYVYMDTYEGWYDVSSETFVREADLVDGKSPDGNEVRMVKEENWFFKLSAFQEPLLAHIEAHPEFLMPQSRKNEVLSFIQQGLRDMCITRANPGWGIPIPGDDSKVVYVWFDALISYLAATGWPEPGWEALWPADIHWMGKEIFVRFHATLWPAMLMGAGLPLPEHVVAHSWFTFGDKSKGNMIYPEDLIAGLEEKTGVAHDLAVDAVKHSLATLLPAETDSNYTVEEVELRYNTDLANDLGNALNRSLSMAHKFVGGVVPDGRVEPEALEAVKRAKSDYEAAMNEFRIDRAQEAALSVVRFLNKYIDTRAPWALSKNADPALGPVVRSMLFCLRSAEGLVRPVMPNTAKAIATQLSLPPLTSWDAIGGEASLPGGTALGQPQPMFPRIDPKLAKKKEAPVEEPKAEKPVKKEKPKFEKPAQIEFEDFMKVDLRIGRVIEAEAVEGSEKLVKLQVTVGAEKRQVLAGIRKNYDPIDLIGRQVVVAFNLKPAKLMGFESQGMLLAADGPNGEAILLQPDKETPEGTGVH